MNKKTGSTYLEWLTYMALWLIALKWIATSDFQGNIDSWLIVDESYEFNMAYSVFVQHVPFLSWSVQPTMHLLPLGPLWLFSTLTHDVRLWELSNALLQISLLFWLWIWIGQTFLGSRQSRLMMAFSAVIIVMMVSHGLPGGYILQPLLGTSFNSYPNILATALVLILVILTYRSESVTLLAVVFVMSLFICFANILFIVNAVAPLSCALIAQRQRQFGILLAISGLLGFLGVMLVHRLLPSFIPLDRHIFIPPSMVLTHLAFLVKKLPLLTLLDIASVILAIYTLTRKKVPDALKLLSWLVIFWPLFAIAAMFFDHETYLTLHYHIFFETHFQASWVFPVFVYLPVMLCYYYQPNIALIAFGLLILVATQIPLLIKPISFAKLHEKHAYLTCLQHLIQQRHLHTGLVRYRAMRAMRASSEFTLDIDAITGDGLWPYTFQTSSLDFTKNKKYDYVIVSTSLPKAALIDRYDDHKKVLHKFGKPSHIITHCPGLTVYLYNPPIPLWQYQ